MATVEVVPTSDIIKDWSFPAAGTHFDDIDEGSGGPDANHINASQGNGDDGDFDSFHMTDGDIEGGEATSITVYTNGKIIGVNKPEIVIGIGGLPLLVEAVNLQTFQSWQTNTLGGLSWDQTDVNNLRITYKAHVPDSKDMNYVYTCYAVITYTAAAGYGHDFLGIPAANIDSIMGIPAANIDNICGL